MQFHWLEIVHSNYNNLIQLKRKNFFSVLFILFLFFILVYTKYLLFCVQFLLYLFIFFSFIFIINFNCATISFFFLCVSVCVSVCQCVCIHIPAEACFTHETISHDDVLCLFGPGMCSHSFLFWPFCYGPQKTAFAEFR